MQMSEKGMVEGLKLQSTKLAELAVKYPAAWKAAAFVMLGRVIDKATPDIPVKTGELKGSDFLKRSDPVVGGFGSDHALVVHENDGGRGFKFLQRALTEMLPGMAAQMAAMVEDFARRGVTIANAPSNHPQTPRTRPGARRARAPVQRTRGRR